jgi:hypothetical protein
MNVLVCGSRAWKNTSAIRERLQQLPRGTVILHGGARGADRTAGTIAASLGLHVREFKADWKNLGKSAGFSRNIQMLEQAPDLVIAFWVDGSSGTGHTVREARKRGIPVEIHGMNDTAREALWYEESK